MGGTPRRWPRRLIIAGVALTVVGALLLAGGTLLVRRYEGAVSRDTLLAANSRAGRSGALTGPLNYLMLGSDARAGNPEAGQRSDTIIIAHVPAGHDRVFLVSIPRDLLVHIPADPVHGFAGEYTKINAAFQFGGGGRTGVQLLSRTLTKLTGARFDGAAVIDFAGLRDVVTLLGGVDVCVDVRTASIHSGRVYQPGCRRMTGPEALDYLRQRKTLPNGDYDRQRHQQQFLKAVFDQMASAGVLTNPVQLDALLRALAGSLTVDLGGASLRDVAYALRRIRPADVTGVAVPSEPETIDDVSYVLADERAAAGLYQALRADTLGDWTARNRQWVNHL